MTNQVNPNTAERIYAVQGFGGHNSPGVSTLLFTRSIERAQELRDRITAADANRAVWISVECLEVENEIRIACAPRPPLPAPVPETDILWDAPQISDEDLARGDEYCTLMNLARCQRMGIETADSLYEGLEGGRVIPAEIVAEELARAQNGDYPEYMSDSNIAPEAQNNG